MTTSASVGAGVNGATSSVNGDAESTEGLSLLDVKIIGYETRGK